jgi:hypothetical protein
MCGWGVIHANASRRVGCMSDMARWEIGKGRTTNIGAKRIFKGGKDRRELDFGVRLGRGSGANGSGLVLDVVTATIGGVTIAASVPYRLVN